MIRKAPEKLAHALLLPINTAAVIILGGYTVLWGAWVANPLTNVFGHAALYHTLSVIAPEMFWGFLAIATGLTTIYGAVTRRYRPLTTGASVAGIFWLTISILYFASDAVSTGGITSLTFAIYSAYIYLNIKVNFKNDKNNRSLLR